MKKYLPKEIESKWQQKWAETGVYHTDLSKDNKYYVLAEFAYPSGDLHVGHWFTFGGADIFARFKRLQGKKVFFPNGFDSFGLPAEGAAIKRNIHPKDWTEENIVKMKQQFSTLGASFDFYGDLASHRPNYYKWNQWIFLKMYEKGLAYRGKYLANWCPSCMTVLANEAVESGKCWRCGSEVVQKEVEQWFFKITDYADRLIWSENSSVDWPKSVQEAQNEWIGRSEGAEVEFGVENSDLKISVFTTAYDTIFGVSFMVVSPEHPLVSDLTTEENKSKVNEYLEVSSKKSELERKENKEKTGVFTGSFVINPFNNEKVPVWIADYVLPGYGTGAVMGVPGHDSRDHEFAEKYDLPVIPVIKPKGVEVALGNDGFWDYLQIKNQYADKSELFNSGKYSGLTAGEAKKQILLDIEKEGFGTKKIEYHIHDWSIGRQRYWGTPIPMVHCPNCGLVPVPEDQLPVELPYEVDFMPKGTSPLGSNKEWMSVKCPKCGGEATRDPDTMDTFVDSSWYFFRYLDPDLTTAAFDTELAKKIMPVDIYFGGAEHTLGHTLYSRFLTKVFHDLGKTELEEYALRRINHGIVLGPDGTKMSKSKGNVVNPDEEVKKYGADAVRIHVAFFMPYDGVGPWISERIWGPYRFLERVWALSEKVTPNVIPSAVEGSADLNLEISHDVRNDSLSSADLGMMHKTIKRVGEDIEQIKFNTAIASLMEWLNYLSAKESIKQEEYKTLLVLLAPFAPHITEELWEMIGESYSIHTQKWPEVDPQYLVDDKFTLVVQINGKVRDNIEVDSSLIDNQSEIEKLALASEKVQKFLEGNTPKKAIYVPGKILSLIS